MSTNHSNLWYAVSVSRPPQSAATGDRRDVLKRRIEGWVFVRAASKQDAVIEATRHCASNCSLIAAHIPVDSYLSEILSGVGGAYTSRLLLPSQYEELMVYVRERLKETVHGLSDRPWFVINWARNGRLYRFVIQAASVGAAVGAASILHPYAPAYKQACALDDPRVAHLNTKLLAYLKTRSAVKYRGHRLSPERWERLLEDAGVTRVSYVYE